MVKKVTVPDSLEGGSTKKQILTKGEHVPLVPPGSAAYEIKKAKKAISLDSRFVVDLEDKGWNTTLKEPVSCI